jgi:hypothetical protein
VHVSPGIVQAAKFAGAVAGQPADPDDEPDAVPEPDDVPEVPMVLLVPVTVAEPEVVLETETPVELEDPKLSLDALVLPPGDEEDEEVEEDPSPPATVDPPQARIATVTPKHPQVRALPKVRMFAPHPKSRPLGF